MRMAAHDETHCIPKRHISCREAADEAVDAAPTASSSSKAPANKKLIAQNVGMSKALQRQIEEEKKVDATVFEYDEVWDKMQETKQKQKEAKEADTKERKVSITVMRATVPLSLER